MTNTNNIDTRVFEGIRKTINRFREKPFYYFTEADIHSSLLNDMLSGSSGILTTRMKKVEISLIHQEYPTNFRYEKSMLLRGYGDDCKKTMLAEGKTYGDRGNFDLAILNKKFVGNMINENTNNLHEALNHIINKKEKLTLQRMKNSKDFSQEIRYAIEVKFLHPANSRNKAMLEEIIKDNEKLRLACCNSDEYIRAINLVFCSDTPRKRRRDKNTQVIDLVREYCGSDSVTDYVGNVYYPPKNVITFFIQAFLNKEEAKNTPKPIAAKKPSIPWSNALYKLIGAQELKYN